MLASGCAELFSLGAVLPFLAVLSDPERLWSEPLVQSLVVQFGWTQPGQLVLPATFLFATSAVLAGLIRLCNIWLNGRIAASVGSDLSCEAYRRTLFQPYSVHVQRNSATVISSTTIQISRTVAALNSLLQIITSAVVVASLLIALLLIDAPVAFGTIGLLGTTYGLLAITARRQLRSNGYKIAEASSQQFKALQEGLGAIRDVLLDGNQSTYLHIYRKADRPQRQLQAKNAFLGAFPRYALEALSMVGISLLGGLLILQRDEASEVIPLLGALALGGQRLLPALQQIYSGWASLKSNNAAVESVLVMLDQPLPPPIHIVEPLPLRDLIRFENVHFSYGAQQPVVLNGLTLEIRRGERIGLIGSTGSGKSTLVDLLMGLLEPTFGKILVDGQDLNDPAHPERLISWRSSITHVPQNIYLADSSIAENIAFGLPRHEIDMTRVKRAAELAQISEFIETTPESYRSFAGERGIRLSGGQRQRIGIARALYNQASIVVLDEATSALDASTEEAVMNSIQGINRDVTIVMIAHRLSTVERCDRLIRMDKGQILEIGSPAQLLGS